MQSKYWKFMVQVKAGQFYLCEYAENSYKAERALNMFTAITSSSCIAAWAIWNQFGYVWAVLIAVSQVVNAIKSYFPYAKRLEIIKPIMDDIRAIFNDMEYKWYRVANGDLTEDEINAVLYGFKKRYDNMENEKITSAILLENNQFKKIADQKTEDYFARNF